MDNVGSILTSILGIEFVDGKIFDKMHTVQINDIELRSLFYSGVTASLVLVVKGAIVTINPIVLRAYHPPRRFYTGSKVKAS